MTKLLLSSILFRFGGDVAANVEKIYLLSFSIVSDDSGLIYQPLVSNLSAMWFQIILTRIMDL